MFESNVKIFKKAKAKITSTDSLEQELLDSFIEEIVPEHDKQLLQFVFTENPTQESLNSFLKTWDIEVEGANKALLLSYFMKIHPELVFPAYVGPRLKGLLNYYRFQNLKLISQFRKICKELRKANIEILVFKGGAMKHLRPDFSRLMGDIDILIHEKDYAKAAQIVEAMGYDCHYYKHSIDLHPKGSEEGILDIHKFIPMETGYEYKINEDLFARATKTKVFGIDAYIPCNEDMAFISLVNMAKNLVLKTSVNGILYTAFDIKFLMESTKNFRWHILEDNAKKAKSENQLSFAVSFLNKMVKGIIPSEMFKYSYSEKFKNYCILLFYKRFFLAGMKQRCHQLTAEPLLKDMKRLKEYLKLRPKYLFFKCFINSPFMAARMIMLNKKYHLVEKEYELN